MFSYYNIGPKVFFRGKILFFNKLVIIPTCIFWILLYNKKRR